MSIDAKHFTDVPPRQISSAEIDPRDKINRVAEVGNVYHGTWEKRTLPGLPKESVLVKELILPINPLYIRLIRREDELLRNSLNPKNIGPKCYGLITTDLPDGARRLSLVMEDIPGETLKNLLTSLPLFNIWPPKRVQAFARSVGLQLADQLIQMQGEGFVHRDIKPGNIMIDMHTGLAQLLDFGAAVTIQEYRQRSPRLDDEIKGYGTPAYLSPEQAMWFDQGITIDNSTDPYALALTLLEIMVGERADAYDYDPNQPHNPANFYDVNQETAKIYTHIDNGVANGKIPAAFGNILKKATEPDQKKRFKDAQEFYNALDQLVI